MDLIHMSSTPFLVSLPVQLRRIWSSLSAVARAVLHTSILILFLFNRNHTHDKRSNDGASITSGWGRPSHLVERLMTSVEPEG